jgi:hypothetical protein
MGMSVSVKGVRDLSVKFDMMMNIKKVCDNGNVGYPAELDEYFGDMVDEHPDFIRSEMEEMDIEYMETHPDSSNIFEVDLSKIPEDVSKIRFIMSY